MFEARVAALHTRQSCAARWPGFEKKFAAPFSPAQNLRTRNGRTATQKSLRPPLPPRRRGSLQQRYSPPPPRAPKKTGIGNSGRTGVGDQRDIFALPHLRHKLRRDFALVEIVVTHHRPVNLIMPQQNRRMTRVLRGDEIDATQRLHRAKRHILQVANRRGNQVEFAGQSQSPISFY